MPAPHICLNTSALWSVCIPYVVSKVFLWLFHLILQMQNHCFPFKKILNFSFLIVFKFHWSVFWLKKQKFYSDSRTGNIYLNLYYINILFLGSKTWENSSLFLFLEIIITTLVIPHFKIHQFPVGSFIFIISVWSVQSTVPVGYFSVFMCIC